MYISLEKRILDAIFLLHPNPKRLIRSPLEVGRFLINVFGRIFPEKGMLHNDLIAILKHLPKNNYHDEFLNSSTIVLKIRTYEYLKNQWKLMPIYFPERKLDAIHFFKYLFHRFFPTYLTIQLDPITSSRMLSTSQEYSISPKRLILIAIHILMTYISPPISQKYSSYQLS